MAAARDLAARILRTEPNTAGDEAARNASADSADSVRAHLSERAQQVAPEVALIARHLADARRASAALLLRQDSLP